MSKKEEINKEDLEFLKALIGESKKEENEIPNIKRFKEQKKKISVASIKDGLIQFDKKSGILRDMGNIYSELEKKDSTISQSFENIENQKKSTKKKKIKKKQLFLEIAEALPIIKQNNFLLKKLIISMENTIKALTEEPIKIKILK